MAGAALAARRPPPDRRRADAGRQDGLEGSRRNDHGAQYARVGTGALPRIAAARFVPIMRDVSTHDPQIQSWDDKYRRAFWPWDRGASHPALAAWLASGVLPPGRIVIPGSGRGHEVLDLARLGFSVTGIDFSSAALQINRAALQSAGLQAELVEADVLAWLPAQPVDAVYEQTCLCAMPPVQWPAYAAQLARWLRPGGQLLALFAQTAPPHTGGPPFHCDLGAMRELFPASHWRWPEAADGQHPHVLGFSELAMRLIRLG